MYECLPVCIYMHHMLVEVRRGHWIPWEIVGPCVVLGTKSHSSRAANAVNFQAISPDSNDMFFFMHTRLWNKFAALYWGSYKDDSVAGGQALSPLLFCLGAPVMLVGDKHCNIPSLILIWCLIPTQCFLYMYSGHLLSFTNHIYSFLFFISF